MTLETERLEIIALDLDMLKLWTEDLPQLEKEMNVKYDAEPMKGIFLEIVKGQLAVTEKDPENYVWHSFWFIVRKSDGTVIGSADFKDVPDENDEVEIGYGLGRAYEKQGYMSECVMAMCAFAFEDERVKRVIAETDTDGFASQRVLERCGFECFKTGETKWFSLGRTGLAVKTVQKKLFSLQDEKYRDFQCKLMPTVERERVIGVRTPAIRAYAKEFMKSSLSRAFLDILPHDYYEENNLHGLILEKIKDFDECVRELDRFLPFVDNWATCDFMRPKVFEKNTDKLIAHIRRWIGSGETYMTRFGIEMLMSFYLDEKFKAEYLDIVAGVRSEEYYVNMMTAWFFATALAKQYDATLPIIEKKRLDTWTHNKAIQKACESYRITDEQKEYLRSLKIKGEK